MAVPDRYQRLLELTHDGVYGFGLHDGRLRHLNAALVALLDLDAPPASLIGQPLSCLPLHAVADDPLLAALRRDGEVKCHDVTFFTPDGRERWVRFDALVETEPEPDTGEPLACAVVRDVTARIEAASALARESEFVAAILETAGAMVVVMDLDGRLVRFNRACEVVTGYAAAEVLGKPFWDIFLLGDEREAVMEVWRELTAGHFPSQHENYWLAKSGEPRWIAWSNTCLTDAQGRVVHVVATGLDQTEARATRELLELNEARAQALLSLGEMHAGTLQEITDFALETAVHLTRSTIGYLAFTNEDESVLTMHSWSKTAMGQCAIIDKPIVYPVVSTGLWGEAVRQRRPVITNDYQAPNPLKKGCPEGHVPVLRHMNIPVFDGERIVAVAGVGNKLEPYDQSDVLQLRLLMDGMWRVLQRREAEAALQRARADLEQRVAERTAELATSNADLEQFAYVASHHLQEPLRKILAFGDRLVTRASAGLEAEGQDCVRRMQTAAERMQQLIDDLLSYSRVTMRPQPFEWVDLTGLVADVKAELAEEIAAAGGEVETSNLPALEADARQMAQLFRHLMDNALKFHRPGTPPRVQVRGERVASDPDSAGPEEWWRIVISDNGQGFEERFNQRIFGVFQRLHDPEQYAGTGIGLALCRKIVERHGGAIEAAGQPGEGARFTITLPARQQPKEAES